MSNYQHDLYVTQKKVKEESEKAFYELINKTNIMNMDKEVAEGLANALLKQHPTLVQSFFRSLVLAAQKVEKSPRFNIDDRAKASGLLLKEIATFDKPLPFI